MLVSVSGHILLFQDVRLAPDILTARTASYAIERDIFAIFATLEVDWDVVNIYTHLLERYPTRTYVLHWDLGYELQGCVRLNCMHAWRSC